MKRCGTMGSGTWAAWALVAMVVAAITPQTALGAGRTVLCEEFSNIT